MISELGYVVVRTPFFSQWLEMAASHVGLHVQVVADQEYALLRMDGKSQRFLLLPDEHASLSMGLLVTDQATLGLACDALAKAGYAVTPATAQELAQRAIQGMAHFADPDGNRVELAFGLAQSSTPLSYGRPIGGFRTGDLGIGHVALKCGHFAEMCHLYKDVLQFKLSDRASAPFAVEFLHVNQRHHTLGLADTGTGPGVYHLMLEYNDWDDVGRAYDLALETPESIGVSLGRHLNDHVTSFYLKTPDGWMLELGWAGRLIDAHWQAAEIPGLSLWGHDRTWLPQPKREQAKALLRELSARGLRAPVITSHTG